MLTDKYKNIIEASVVLDLRRLENEELIDFIDQLGKKSSKKFAGNGSILCVLIYHQIYTLIMSQLRSYLSHTIVICSFGDFNLPNVNWIQDHFMLRIFNNFQTNSSTQKQHQEFSDTSCTLCHTNTNQNSNFYK